MKLSAQTPKRKSHYIVFRVIIILIIIFVLFKPVAKCFYPVRYMDIIQRFSREYKLDEHLVMALISTESKFDKNAVSHKGAKGLMQLKEKTALWCMENFDIKGSTTDIYNPELNIQIGCAYLRYLTDKFGSDINTVLAAYNAGEGNVTKWLREQGGELKSIPFEETKKYVESVNNKTKIYHFLY